MPDAPTTRYLDPAALARLRNLGLAARLVVEGLFSGQHRSPHRGYSVEFAEHRQYTPGVDPRHLDWKILAKRDKLYVKQYEEQTNLRGYLVVDASASMGYKHSGAVTKLEYACFCAAALAYLMQSQHDAFGLITCNDGVASRIPPRQGRGHLRIVLDALERLKPSGQIDLAKTFHDLAQSAPRRGLVIVLSDLFTDGHAGDLVEAVGHLRHKKHEVLVLHLLDNAELTFPFDDATQIEDLETGQVIAADGGAMRRQYLDKLDAHVRTIKSGCLAQAAGYALGNTDEPFDRFLGEYLSRRMQGG